jgi:NADH-quinone oxidoreductase subunit N
MALVLPDLRWTSIAPELIVCVTGLVVLIIGILSRRKISRALAYLSLVGIAAAFVALPALWGKTESGFSRMVVLDPFALYFHAVILLAAGVTVLMSLDYLDQEGLEHYEYFALLLFGTFGMMLMASALDLIMVFLGLETMSISIYVLAGWRKDHPKGHEAAIKYLLLGAFASAFLLYGIALIFGATGTTNLKGVADVLARKGTDGLSPLLLGGAAMLLVGFGFKVASVPFHMWTPDIYDGAPTPITAYMTAAVKAAAFAAFLRVFFYSLSSLQGDLSPAFWVLAVATMTLGNVVALVQENIKRMFAYSSIAHVGYILVGMVTGGDLANASVLFYLLAYALMNMGAFGVVTLYGRKGEANIFIEDYRGMGFQYPALGALMAVFMFSMAGIPPTAGFFAKFYVFSAAVDKGYVWLVVIALLNSVVSVYYYFRVTVKMYMQAPEKEEVEELRFGPAVSLALGLMLIGTLWLGVYPGIYLHLAREALPQLF